jgi:hypothetical protein
MGTRQTFGFRHALQRERGVLGGDSPYWAADSPHPGGGDWLMFHVEPHVGRIRSPLVNCGFPEVESVGHHG